MQLRAGGAHMAYRGGQAQHTECAPARDSHTWCAQKQHAGSTHFERLDLQRRNSRAIAASLRSNWLRMLLRSPSVLIM